MNNKLLVKITVSYFGFGFLRPFPGTIGTGAAAGTYLLIQHFLPGYSPWICAVGVVLSCLLAMTIGENAEQVFGKKDPSPFVLDEVAGFFVTIFPATLIPPGAGYYQWKLAAAGFIAFRIFDIGKFWGARKLESVPGTLGIMLDDLLAGVYSSVFVFVAILLTKTYWP
jgi:phosphatidylglycerophosphatase A